MSQNLMFDIELEIVISQNDFVFKISKIIFMISNIVFVITLNGEFTVKRRPVAG